MDHYYYDSILHTYGLKYIFSIISLQSRQIRLKLNFKINIFNIEVSMNKCHQKLKWFSAGRWFLNYEMDSKFEKTK